MFEKLTDNLNLLMDEKRISADELSRRTDIPSSTIKKIRNHYNPNPTLTTLLPLAKFFSVTLSQLIGDEPLPESRVEGIYQPNSQALQQIPVLSWKEAITWPNTNKRPHTFLSSEYHYGKNAFALIVQEESWENLSKGTALLIDPALVTEHRDYVIVHKRDQTTPTLKQALFDEGELYLKSLFHGQNIIPITPEHRLLGVVVEYKKHLKKSIVFTENDLEIS